MDKKKWIAGGLFVVGLVAGAVSASAWGANANVHTACDIVIKVIAGLGLAVPVSLFGGSSSSSGASAPVLKLSQPDKETP